MKYISISLTIGKTDGVLREASSNGSAGNNRTISIADVRLNPGIDDSEFIPPEGVEVQDDTDRLIALILNRREN